MAEIENLGARPVTTYYVGSDQFLVDRGTAEGLRVVDAGTLHTLHLCRNSASLADHSDLVLAAGGGMIAPLQLAELVRGDLFVDYHRLHGAAQAGHATTPLSVVAIPTADRPQSLRRCLLALQTHCASHAEFPDLLVVDGSRESANRTETRDVVAEIGRSWNSHTAYVGPSEAADIRRLLAVSGAAPETLAFAFTPGPTGCNRNLILALTRGRHVLMLDDDVICRTWTPSAVSGTTFLGHAEACALNFFETRAQALESVAFRDVNLFRAHSELLGRPVSALLATCDGTPAVQSPCSHLVAALGGTMPAGAVVVTFAGLAGDAGTYCSHRALFSQPAVNHVVFREEAEYTRATTSRERTRIAEGLCVTHDPWCMAYCMGIANDREVPMFGPLGRNQDGLFGRLLSFVDESAFFGHVPVGVIHDSPRSSTYERPMISASETLLNDTLATLMAAYRPSRLSPGDRLPWLGRTFSSMSRLPLPTLGSEIRAAVLERRSQDFLAADRLMAECPSSAPWRDLDAYKQQFVAATQDEWFFIPVELRDRGGLAGVRAYLASLGDLLTQWTVIMQAADGLDLRDPDWSSLTATA